MPDKFFEEIDRIGAHAKFRVLRLEGLRHQSRIRSLVVGWIFFEADTESSYRFLAQLAHDADDDTGINPATEEGSKGNVRDHPGCNSLLEKAAQCFFRLSPEVLSRNIGGR